MGDGTTAGIAVGSSLRGTFEGEPDGWKVK
jgi:hypothetical protein